MVCGTTCTGLHHSVHVCAWVYVCVWCERYGYLFGNLKGLPDWFLIGGSLCERAEAVAVRVSASVRGLLLIAGFGLVIYKGYFHVVTSHS